MYFSIFLYYYNHSTYTEAVVARGHKGVTVTLQLWVRSPLEGMHNYFINIFITSLWHQNESLALNSSTQHAMAWKIPRKVGNRVSQHLGLSALPCCGIQLKAEHIFIEYNKNTKKVIVISST